MSLCRKIIQLLHVFLAFVYSCTREKQAFSYVMSCNVDGLCIKVCNLCFAGLLELESSPMLAPRD